MLTSASISSILIFMIAKKIVFANQKGGVGKTTTAVNVGAYLAKAGKKVLLVDFDPQGNMSSSVSVDESLPGIYEVISEQATLFEAVQRTPVENLFIVSSDINLTGASIELAKLENNQFILKEQLDKVNQEWDFILIDCPPSLGLLTLNGMVASDYVLVPLQCEYFALEGLSMLLRTIHTIQKSLNKDLTLLGVAFTMFDSRTRLANEVVKDVSAYFKDKTFKSKIPRNVRLSEAPSHGLPIVEYDARCAGAVAYKNLAKEVVERV